MSREKSWQVPGKGAIYELPFWIVENAKFIHSRDKIELEDGSVAKSGDWITLKNGQLEKK